MQKYKCNSICKNINVFLYAKKISKSICEINKSKYILKMRMVKILYLPWTIFS